MLRLRQLGKPPKLLPLHLTPPQTPRPSSSTPPPPFYFHFQPQPQHPYSTSTSSSPPLPSSALAPPFNRADDLPQCSSPSRLAGPAGPGTLAQSNPLTPSSWTETAPIYSICSRYGGAAFGNSLACHGPANRLPVRVRGSANCQRRSYYHSYYHSSGLYKGAIPTIATLSYNPASSRKPYSSHTSAQTLSKSSATLISTRPQLALDKSRRHQNRVLSTSHPTMYTASFAFFEAIWEAGITHCFVNLGSDHPSIIEAMVKGQNENKGKFPRIITCPNEVCSQAPVVRLRRRFGPDSHQLVKVIQTNATLIDGSYVHGRRLRASNRQAAMCYRPC